MAWRPRETPARGRRQAPSLRRRRRRWRRRREASTGRAGRSDRGGGMRGYDDDDDDDGGVADLRERIRRRKTTRGGRRRRGETRPVDGTGRGSERRRRRGRPGEGRRGWAGTVPGRMRGREGDEDDERRSPSVWMRRKALRGATRERATEDGEARGGTRGFRGRERGERERERERRERERERERRFAGEARGDRGRGCRDAAARTSHQVVRMIALDLKTIAHPPTPGCPPRRPSHPRNSRAPRRHITR